MKKARIKQQKSKKEITTSEEFSTKSKVITGVLLVLALIGFYFLTIKLVKNRGKEEEPEVININVRETNNINYSDIEDIKDSSYYLLLDKEDDENNTSYDSYINALKYSNYPDEFYYINLSSDENKDLLTEKDSLKELDKLKVKDTTLLYISDGKIKESYVGSEKIIAQLQSFFVSVETEDNNTIKANSNSNSNKEDKSNSNSNSNKEENSNSNKNSNKEEKSNSNKDSNKKSNEK